MLKLIAKIILLVTGTICLCINLSWGSDLSFSIKGGYFHYSEPDIDIAYSGLVSGIQGDYQKNLPYTTFKLRSEFMTGRLSYDGQLNTHTVADGSMKISETSGSSISYHSNLWYSDSSVLLGKSFVKKYYTITPFTGIGYRYLYNPENSDVQYDYTRQVSYIYLPLVVEFKTTSFQKPSWGLTGEVDILLHGSAKAKLSDASKNYNDLEFTQSVGGAVKLAGFYNQRFLGLAISIRPFVDVWFVDNSDTDVLTYEDKRVLVKSAKGSYDDYREPANITMTAGLQLNVRF